jgi:transcriptional regulator
MGFTYDEPILEQRDHGLDTGAAAQQRRRLAAIGDWKTHCNQQ